MTPFSDLYWRSADGLTLHARDYQAPSGQPPVICIHGLTRNARDFEDLAPDDMVGLSLLMIPAPMGQCSAVCGARSIKPSLAACLHIRSQPCGHVFEPVLVSPE